MKEDIYKKQDKIFEDYIKNFNVYTKKNLEEDRNLFISHINKVFSCKSTSEILSLKVKKEESKQPVQKKSSLATTYYHNDVLEEWLKKNPTVDKEKELEIHSQSLKKSSHFYKGKNLPILDLHGYTKEESLKISKKFIDHLPKNIKKLRIIHGKGISTGKKSVIREEIRNWLLYEKKYGNLVKDFSYETPQNGGHGATVIWLN